ncbi:GNAT family N-acetyltransferase [Altererythrobacter sp. H2]|uniref:GNAT family N-acetyltransferase n=1 Tax=Altererythrobacter sp. H2 TaxID=3108391 RepID=UPI002B4BAAF2|nr:GNAT family N-acetyltransferase [Altererythrobacter sp. H2]WRK94749.1 GNAT family N-acetyltransferase [Altererythrobacter sp. H2]
MAAIPLTRMGPDLLGAKGVPGSYWPCRSPLFSPDLHREELADLLADPLAATALAPLWRIGPANAADRATRMVMEASALAGWTVLVRELGETWLFDLAGAAQENGGNWPRKSTRKRLTGYERRLAQEGEVSWLQISGADWSAKVLEQLGRIEADSWVGKTTDGSGAKFLTPAQRARWQTALSDPVIADALSATILLLHARPIAFSFDLRSGDKQYAIAGSYAEDMAGFRVGKIVTCRQLEGALAQGVRLVDLGSGDSGYKREMGAVCGPALFDLLIVRQRKAALLLARNWGHEPADLRQMTLASPHRVDLPLPSLKHIAAAAALAGTAVVVAE